MAAGQTIAAAAIGTATGIVTVTAIATVTATATETVTGIATGMTMTHAADVTAVPAEPAAAKPSAAAPDDSFIRGGSPFS